ncbi:hypothetical protein Ait01nite_000980 [Actinoplanes italicus]|uniref:Uncharacterized protein n=1 Tax=Actinoplanes italicus TaxID=113567 RepID=A0A2T0KDJ5_9ACTN|nr:hypothetical protein [Actinoplanes italicus]PRX21375.1 hypothetical protein CLV67_106155 [Actinoplanes italicus]GIE27053.1 hypothetical protein Ait01nite_000980 [Actinoplanes italicus]
MERIPQDMAEAVRVAAGAARGYPGDLADIHRRARRFRRRQMVLSAAAVVAVVAGAGAGVSLMRRAEPAPPPAATGEPVVAVPSVAPSTGPASSPAAKGPVQHLVLRDADGTYEAPSGKRFEIGGETRLAEILPDGTLVTHDVVGSRNWERLVVLADGSLVALGSHDTRPGTKRTDGPDVTGVEYRLVVTRPDGKVRIQRDVRRQGEPVVLVTATATTAYLWRPAGLVSHNLTTGKERIVVRSAAVQVGDADQIRFIDLSGNRLAIARMRDECVPRVYDVTTGRLVAEIPLTASGCIALSDMRVSPDGATLAVVYDRNGEKGLDSAADQIRISDGKVLNGTFMLNQGFEKIPPAITAAWENDKTLRLAVYPVGASGVSLMNLFSMTID